MGEFKVGDGVKCKFIEGPDMVVAGSQPNGFGGMAGWITCMWYSEQAGMYTQWNFPPEMLEKIED